MNPFTGGAPRRRSRPNLYELLPTIYRRRDEQIDAAPRDRPLDADDTVRDVLAPTATMAPLKALFAILQGEFDSVERDIAGLYDDWFVETCTPEMLPRIAEPLGIRELDTLIKGGADVRAVVANIINYRRRKGTAGALEEFAADATGWAVQVDEGSQRVATTVRVDGEAVRRTGYADVRRRPPATAASPSATRYADVGEAGGGEYATVIGVWRATAAQISGAEPGYPDAAVRRKRTFNALGDDLPLMVPGIADGRSEHRWARPLTREDARAELARSGAITGISLTEMRGLTQRPPRLEIADLSAGLWQRPEQLADPHTVYVDPELGRLLTPDHCGRYTADYWVGVHPTIGAAPPSAPWPGSFDRTLLVAPRARRGATRFARLEAQLLNGVLLMDQPSFEQYRSKIEAIEFDHFGAQWSYIRSFADREHRVPSPHDLGRRWPLFPLAAATSSTEELIAALSAPDKEASCTRFGTLDRALNEAATATGSVRIVLGTSTTHVAPDGWTFRPGHTLTALSIESAPGTHPSLHGSLFLLPYATSDPVPPPHAASVPQSLTIPKAIPIRLRGLDVLGRIVCGQNAALTIEHSTLRPAQDERGRRSLEDAAHTQLATQARRIDVRNSFLGGARLSDSTELSIEDSVVTDPIGPLDRGPSARGPYLNAQRSTFLGTVDAYQLIASDSLFDQRVRAKLPQRGYLRYSLVRSEQDLPPRYKCVVTSRPVLAGRVFGRARFARLRADAPDDVVHGSSDGSEIGAFGPYGDALRRANLEIVMDEYLPEGVSRRVSYRS